MLDGLVETCNLASLSHHLGNTLANSDPEVDDVAFAQLAVSTSCDQRADVQELRRIDGDRAAEFSRQQRIIRELVAHLLIWIDDDRVDDRAWNTDRPRRQRIQVNGRPNLRDDDAARIMRGQGGGIDIDIGRLLIEADIAVRIAERATDNGNIDRKGFVPEELVASDRDDLDEILLGGLVHLAALLARIDEGAEAYMGEQPWPLSGDLAIELHHAATWQNICFDLFVACHLLHLRRPDPMPANHPLDETFVGEMIHSLGFLVSDSKRMKNREVSRKPG